MFLFGWPLLRPGEGRQAKGEMWIDETAPSRPRPEREMMSWLGRGRLRGRVRINVRRERRRVRGGVAWTTTTCVGCGWLID